MEELVLLREKLYGACCPEDVFGTAGDPRKAYLKLARACHTDTHKEPIALSVFQKLTELWREAEKRIEDGDYGKKNPLIHCIPLEIGKYKVDRKPIVGDICDIYSVEGKDLLVKVARSHDDNDLLRAEANSLRLLNKGINGPVSNGIPTLVDTLKIDGTWKREGNVLSSSPGFFSALEVHQKMVVDARTAVWMFKRILAVLTWTHHFELIHGAILPSHILFYPDNDEGSPFALPGQARFKDPRKHSIRLIDWCYSVNFKNRTRLSSWIPAWKDHYAPELLKKSFIGPASDIYMAASLINYLCGSLPKSLETILTRCLSQDHTKRYQKAGEVLEDWKRAAAVEFGSPQWHDFNLP